MLYNPKNWYEWFVHQSRTDHIYDLIHDNIPHDFEPNHPGDFVLLNPVNLPAKLVQPLALLDKCFVSAARIFAGPSFQLIPNQALTEFLEAAHECRIIQDSDDKNYVLLLFNNRAEQEKPQEDKGLAYDENDVLQVCWRLVTAGQDREAALPYAVMAEGFLDSRFQEVLSSGGDLGELARIRTGYNIPALAYLWNNKLQDAQRCEVFYLTQPHLWPLMEGVIGTYLEMLMAKKEHTYLAEIFQRQDFQSYFIAHYETYISLFLNPHYECTKMKDMVAIINRVNNGFKRYL